MKRNGRIACEHINLLLPGCTITKQISINIYSKQIRDNTQHVVIDYKEKLFWYGRENSVVIESKHKETVGEISRQEAESQEEKIMLEKINNSRRILTESLQKYADSSMTSMTCCRI